MKPTTFQCLPLVWNRNTRDAVFEEENRFTCADDTGCKGLKCYLTTLPNSRLLKFLFFTNILEWMVNLSLYKFYFHQTGLSPSTPVRLYQTALQWESHSILTFFTMLLLYRSLSAKSFLPETQVHAVYLTSSPFLSFPTNGIIYSHLTLSYPWGLKLSLSSSKILFVIIQN